METDNRGVYYVVHLREFAFSQPNLEEAIQQFNTTFSNNFIEDVTAHRFSIIPRGMKSTAEYMATYDLNNLTQFVEALDVFGNLQYYLDRYIGLLLPMEIISNLRIGEVVDEFLPHPPLDVEDMRQEMSYRDGCQPNDADWR